MTDSPRPGPPARDPTPGAPVSAPVVRSPGRPPTEPSPGAHAGPSPPQAPQVPLTSGSPAAVAAGAATALAFTFNPRDERFPQQIVVVVYDVARVDDVILRYPGAAFWSWRAFWRYFKSLEDSTAARVTAFDPDAGWPPSDRFAQKYPRALQKVQAGSRLEFAQINLLKIEFGPRGVALLEGSAPDTRARADRGKKDQGSSPAPRTEPGSVHFSRPSKYRGHRKALKP